MPFRRTVVVHLVIIAIVGAWIATGDAAEPVQTGGAMAEPLTDRDQGSFDATVVSSAKLKALILESSATREVDDL